MPRLKHYVMRPDVQPVKHRELKDVDALTTQLEQVASCLVAADKDNLPALAQAHTALCTLESLARNSNAARPDVADITAGLASSIEKIILNETANSEAALEEVSQSIGELRDLVNGALTRVPPASPLPSLSQSTLPASLGSPPPIEAEPLIPESDVSLAQEFIAEAAAHLDAAEAALLLIESGSGDNESINAVFRSFHTIKGVAGFINLRQIGALAHVAEGLLDAARHDRLTLTGSALEHVLEALDMMRTLLGTLTEALRQSRPQASEAKLPDLINRISQIVAGLNHPPSTTSKAPLHAPTGLTSAPSAPLLNSTQGDPRLAKGPEPSDPQAADTKRTDADAMVKVGTARLDSLINMVGELLIAQAMVREGALEYASKNPGLMRSMGHLSKIARELQDLSMSMRMVPIQGVFQKMARLVRDVARKAGKEVEFVTTGGETELDRNVVEAVGDPLVHMVRNAIDHGLEPPHERVALGKPAAGRVELRAFHLSGNVVIQITDDGRGLNKDKIIRKAVDAGIARPDQQFTDQEAFALIFHAGLSTADKVTDVSGRGVGMDVVRRNIDSLRGRIEIASSPGKGSTFTIRLPLTLAMIDGMVVRVGDARFIVPMTSIEQSLRPRHEQLSTLQGRGEVCMVRGSLLPLYRLSRIFEIKDAVSDPASALTVILQDNDRRCCMLVDELLGQQQVVIKSLGTTVGRVAGVSGGAILGDGTVSLILDVPGLIDLAVESYGSQDLPAPRAEHAPPTN